jgi:hypothetical protein
VKIDLEIVMPPPKGAAELIVEEQMVFPKTCAARVELFFVAIL